MAPARKPDSDPEAESVDVLPPEARQPHNNDPSTNTLSTSQSQQSTSTSTCTASAAQTARVPFARVIEADHASLTHLAVQTTQANIAYSARISHLTTLLWRLIRHDVSEELVMRPAFAKYMGAEGVAAATQDRHDHADLKVRLVALYERALGAERGAECLGEDGEDGEDWLLREIKALSREMGMHMKQESGVVLPRFETLVSREVNLELGEMYAKTLALTPEVRLPGVNEKVRASCFVDVMAYAKADIDVFRDILSKLDEIAGRGEDHGYMNSEVERAMTDLDLHQQLVDNSCEHSSRSGKAKGNL